MATKNVEAIILSRRDYGEADRLLLAFSRSLGKIKIIARGARKIKSKLACTVEPFSVGKYFLAEGKTFYILAGGECNQDNLKISDDIELFKDVSYVTEILDMVTVENQPNETIFNLACETIDFLKANAETKRQIILRVFEFKVLEFSGFKPQYIICADCGKKLQPSEFFYGSFEGIFCPDCKKNSQKIDLNTVKILRAFSGGSISDILHIAKIEHYNQSLKEVILPKLYDILPKKPRSQTL